MYKQLHQAPYSESYLSHMWLVANHILLPASHIYYQLASWRQAMHDEIKNFDK